MASSVGRTWLGSVTLAVKYDVRVDLDTEEAILTPVYDFDPCEVRVLISFKILHKALN